MSRGPGKRRTYNCSYIQRFFPYQRRPTPRSTKPFGGHCRDLAAHYTPHHTNHTTPHLRQRQRAESTVLPTPVQSCRQSTAASRTLARRWPSCRSSRPTTVLSWLASTLPRVSQSPHQLSPTGRTTHLFRGSATPDLPSSPPTQMSWSLDLASQRWPSSGPYSTSYSGRVGNRSGWWSVRLADSAAALLAGTAATSRPPRIWHLPSFARS